MKFLLIIGLFVLGLSACAAPMPNAQANKYADAIKRVENSTKYPYGIKSIDTKGNAAKARRICINTVKNNYIRWQNAGNQGEYVDFLANVYCPISADPVGNKNWKKNIRAFLSP